MGVPASPHLKCVLGRTDGGHSSVGKGAQTPQGPSLVLAFPLLRLFKERKGSLQKSQRPRTGDMT